MLSHTQKTRVVTPAILLLLPHPLLAINLDDRVQLHDFVTQGSLIPCVKILAITP